VNKTQRLLEALQWGDEVTAGQARQRFGIQNVRAAAHHLRQQGYAVYGNSKTDSRGRKVTRYRLGAPSRAVVAAGYRALANA